MKKLLIITPYFGNKPKWLNFFLASCAKNTDVDWLLISDFEIPHKPKNCQHLHTSFLDYKDIVAKKLNLNLDWSDPYKLCDLKPALGYIHYEVVKNYEFWGYSDIDLVFGNILEKYDDYFSEFDVISSHSWLLAGHFCVYKSNMRETLMLFSAHRQWIDAFKASDHLCFDEFHMSKLLMPEIEDFNAMRDIHEVRRQYQIGEVTLNLLFKEQFTTFMGGEYLLPSGQRGRPTRWLWKSGELTNDVMDGTILYCHFSFWNTGRYQDGEDPDGGIWNRNSDTRFPEVAFDDIKEFSISRQGFELIS